MVHLLLAAVMQTAPQDTVVLNIDQAVAVAVAVSPLVTAAQGAVMAPRGERAEARWPFPSNPTLDFLRVRRSSPGSRSFDREWVLSQEIEIAGQNFVRAGAAGKRVRAAESLADDARRLAALEARQSFVALSLGEHRAALIDSSATFAERLARIAQQQLDAGEINRLIYNAAVLEAARQRSAADRALADLDAAAAELGRVLALDPSTVPRTAPLPSLPALELDTVSVLATGRRRRPDLAAADLAARAAAQNVTAARLGIVPNLTIGGVIGREADSDDLRGFTIGFTVPLFQRNQGTTGIARAESAAARAAYEATERRVLAEIQAAVQRYRRAVRAEARFAREVLQAASENVVLTDRAFAEGKVDITDVVVLRSAAVNAQLEYLAVQEDAYVAWFRLAAALDVEPDDLINLTGVSR